MKDWLKKFFPVVFVQSLACSEQDLEQKENEALNCLRDI